MVLIKALLDRSAAWVRMQFLSRTVMPKLGLNPFQQGAFTPVASEQECLDSELRVEGCVPSELDGMYLRIGPNPPPAQHHRLAHWFLGDGMIHGVRLARGRPQWYRSKWVGTNGLRDHLGQARAPGPRRGVCDIVNTNVYAHAGKIWASVEAGALPVELDAKLNTVRHGLFNDSAVQSYSGHPHRDPLTGKLHAIAYDGLRRTRLQHVVISKEGRLEKSVDIRAKDGPMVHDCAITSRNILVLDCPLTFSFMALVKGEPLPYHWNRAHGARLGILPLDSCNGSDIQWIDMDMCHVFHTCNAFEDDVSKEIILDLITRDHIFDGSNIGPPLEMTAHFERWRISRQTGGISKHRYYSGLQEFPRFDERLTGRPYQWAYAIEGNPSQGCIPHHVLKYDLVGGSLERHTLLPHRVPGEFVFVPRHKKSAEDDGWLMGYVQNLETRHSELLILDAANISGPPVATIHIPVRIPQGFHGNWIAAAEVPALNRALDAC